MNNPLRSPFEPFFPAVKPLSRGPNPEFSRMAGDSWGTIAKQLNFMYPIPATPQKWVTPQTLVDILNRNHVMHIAPEARRARFVKMGWDPDDFGYDSDGASSSDSEPDWGDGGGGKGGHSGIRFEEGVSESKGGDEEREWLGPELKTQLDEFERSGERPRVAIITTYHDGHSHLSVFPHYIDINPDDYNELDMKIKGLRGVPIYAFRREPATASASASASAAPVSEVAGASEIERLIVELQYESVSHPALKSVADELVKADRAMVAANLRVEAAEEANEADSTTKTLEAYSRAISDAAKALKELTKAENAAEKALKEIRAKPVAVAKPRGRSTSKKVPSPRSRSLSRPATEASKWQWANVKGIDVPRDANGFIIKGNTAIKYYHEKYGKQEFAEVYEALQNEETKKYGKFDDSPAANAERRAAAAEIIRSRTATSATAAPASIHVTAGHGVVGAAASTTR